MSAGHWPKSGTPGVPRARVGADGTPEPGELMVEVEHDWSDALLDAAPDAMVVVDPGGRILLINDQTERLFGYSREELVGQEVDVLVPLTARQAHPAHRQRYLERPVPRPMGAGMQLAGRRKDGSEFPAEVSLSTVDTSRGTVVAAAVRDVSERLAWVAERERLKAEADRERMEAQLHQSQRLESLGQLAGGVAHDFNNLLAVIVNYTSFVAEEVERLSRGEEAPYDAVLGDIEQIQLAAGRATALTHQLLAFGRREVVRPKVLDLNVVVQELERLLQRTLGEHVRLTTDLAEDLRPVYADQGQLEQVLVNLAVNARDAMPGGGTLTIDTSNEDVDEGYSEMQLGLLPGRYVRLRVGDNGTGMPADVRQRAFEPFYTTKPKGEGSGLGLATVHGIVHQAGGWLQIYSEEGLGTAITILLPESREREVEATPSHHVREEVHREETVLVIEDEEALRQVTRRILVRRGYQVLVASSGPEALAMMETYDGPLHLLLTDVVMPHMLGKEVATRMLDLRPDLRVLYMSGYAQPVLASQGSLEPDVVLLEKPFSETSMLRKVREVLDS